MNPKSIGVVGGAGPFAAIFLLERIFQLAQQQYGCYKDSDFPKVHLINFPFSDMLSEKSNADIVKRELKQCLELLKNCSIIAIACNTLHAFLNEEDIPFNLIHLIKVTKEKLESEIPLILCTSTSKKYLLHRQFFECIYPEVGEQKKVDQSIELILKGNVDEATIKLNQVINSAKESIIVLGCTELSLIAPYLKSSKRILDSLEISAKLIVEKSFKE